MRASIDIDPACVASLQGVARRIAAVASAMDRMKPTMADVRCHMDAVLGPDVRAPERPGDRERLVDWIERARARR